MGCSVRKYVQTQVDMGKSQRPVPTQCFLIPVESAWSMHVYFCDNLYARAHKEVDSCKDNTISHVIIIN